MALSADTLPRRGSFVKMGRRTPKEYKKAGQLEIVPKARRSQLFTPLRYPGGKTSLFAFFDSVIQANNLRSVTYIEPYAGGAGAALSLLFLEKVKSIVINDYDRAIFAFWKSILEETDAFIDLVEDTPLTVEEWQKQHHIYYTKKQDAPILELGFAAFYLNRTNRSGILKGGPIGGHSQTGKWLIDARYNKQALIEKIEKISRHRKDITVLNDDGLGVIQRYASKRNSLFYIDPPYYKQGGSLYYNAYKEDDHKNLAELLNTLSGAKWILTYDNVPEIRRLYRERLVKEFSLHYQAHSSRQGSEVMIFSDSLA